MSQLHSDLLQTMITNQHNQLLQQSRTLCLLAVICVMATLAVFISAAFCAVVYPAAAILLTLLLSATPLTILSGAVLFWQCFKRQKQAQALIAMVADQVKNETAVSVSTSIDDVAARDKTKSELSMQIASATLTNGRARNTSLSGLFRRFVGEGSL